MYIVLTRDSFIAYLYMCLVLELYVSATNSSPADARSTYRMFRQHPYSHVNRQRLPAHHFACQDNILIRMFNHQRLPAQHFACLGKILIRMFRHQRLPAQHCRYLLCTIRNGFRRSLGYVSLC